MKITFETEKYRGLANALQHLYVSKQPANFCGEDLFVGTLRTVIYHGRDAVMECELRKSKTSYPKVDSTLSQSQQLTIGVAFMQLVESGELTKYLETHNSDGTEK